MVARPNPPRIEKTKPSASVSAKTERFVVRQYDHQHVADQKKEKGDFAEALFWNPLLIAGPDGKVTLSFDLSDLITTFRLQADAHGTDRIGSARVKISAQKPTDSEGK